MGVLLVLVSCQKSEDPTPIIENVHNASFKQPILPVLAHKDLNKVVKLRFYASNGADLKVNTITFNLEGTTDVNDIKELKVYYAKQEDVELDHAPLFGQTTSITNTVSVSGTQNLQNGNNYFWLNVKLNGVPELTHKINVEDVSLKLSNGEVVNAEMEEKSGPQKIGIALLQKNQNNVHTYRIPGLATTNNGTLIAVYDNRYFQGADLQGDIDVGMSRSTDGGQTWEPMKPIIDMGEYGGKPEDQNGIGDPSVLVDRETNTIWVGGLWIHGYPGQRAWNASQPGIKPEETGQFVLVKSEDDGVTWSEPINITSQIKKTEWQLLLQGPGKGITMKDGTLVFPAQFKDENRMPHATIIYSKDHGATWKIGTGAKSNTTEAQVVELADGSLMLNMRDNRGGSRSVAITQDLGETWSEHSSSRKALVEPVCMASLISFEHPEKGQVLFFSNPNTTSGRTNITVKTSFDQGLTWPKENQLEIYEDLCYGYSCMTMIDENHIGILYEGSAELYFEKINLNELFD